MACVARSSPARRRASLVMATRCPPAAAVMAATSPAGPPPRTTRSDSPFSVGPILRMALLDSLLVVNQEIGFGGAETRQVFLGLPGLGEHQGHLPLLFQSA